MSPSASFRHQSVAGTIYAALAQHLRETGQGVVVYEADVRLSADLVYRPDIAFFAAGRVSPDATTPAIAPDLILEVLSPKTRAMDLRTKLADYEVAGVRAYWIIDPEAFEVWCYESVGKRFATLAGSSNTLQSAVVAGFQLSMSEVRARLPQ